MNARWWAAACIAMAVVLGLIGRQHQLPSSPAQRTAATAEPWMADALPGIGARSIDQAVEAIRAGRFDELPKPARAAAEEAFTRPAPDAER